MKKLLTLLFLLITFNLYSQNQIVELCEDSNKTFTYYSLGTPNCVYNWAIKLNNRLIRTFKTEKITYTFEKEGNYEITVFSENELCESETQEYVIKVIPCRIPVVYIPNSFTPNSDGLNDTWRPVGSYIESMVISVYNNWGGLVYKTDDMGFVWDGTVGGLDAPTGVYIYFVEFVTIKGVYNYKVGSLTIYR